MIYTLETLKWDKISLKLYYYIIKLKHNMMRISADRSDYIFSSPPPGGADVIEENTCPVCYELFSSNSCSYIFIGVNSLYKLDNCSHKLCNVCIENWVKIHNNCPVCRTVQNYNSTIAPRQGLFKYIENKILEYIVGKYILFKI